MFLLVSLILHLTTLSFPPWHWEWHFKTKIRLCNFILKLSKLLFNRLKVQTSYGGLWGFTYMFLNNSDFVSCLSWCMLNLVPLNLFLFFKCNKVVSTWLYKYIQSSSETTLDYPILKWLHSALFKWFSLRYYIIWLYIYKCIFFLTPLSLDYKFHISSGIILVSCYIPKSSKGIKHIVVFQ